LLILRPFLHTIILSAILASLFYPLQLLLVRFYGGRRNAAALTVVVTIILLVIIPLFSFTSALVAQGLDSINRINEWISAGNMQRLLENPKINGYTTWIREHLDFCGFTKMNLQQYLLQASKQAGQLLLGHGVGLVRDVASMVFHFFVMIFLTFYLFLAIVGGVNYFGLVGILYGPLILGFTAVMLYTYRVEYNDRHRGKGEIMEEAESGQESMRRSP
jgi:predicted PurR-regulated permease PerM